MNEFAKLEDTPGGRSMQDFSTWGKKHRREFREKKAKAVRKVILGSICPLQLLLNINYVSFSALFHIRVQPLCLPPPLFIHRIYEGTHCNFPKKLTTHSMHDGQATLEFRPFLFFSKKKKKTIRLLLRAKYTSA